jgi:hypothetical protein
LNTIRQNPRPGNNPHNSVVRDGACAAADREHAAATNTNVQKRLRGTEVSSSQEQLAAESHKFLDLGTLQKGAMPW